MYEFFRDDEAHEKGDRLHEYTEKNMRRKYYNSMFEPGKVGPDVLDALGLQQDDDLDRLPWYFRMLEWGYPPGWLSVKNPKNLVDTRIENEGLIENADSLQIFRSGSPSSSEGDSNDGVFQGIEQKPSDPTRNDLTPRRWASYTTTLFSSELLPVYSGKPLPDDKNRIDFKGLHPWRLPGAFSAFGPTGWQEVVKIYDSKTQTDECEMDLSD